MTCSLVVKTRNWGYLAMHIPQYLSTWRHDPSSMHLKVNGLLLARCVDALLLHPFTPEYSDCPNYLGVCPESSPQDYASTFWLLHCVSCRAQDRKRSASSKTQNLPLQEPSESKGSCDLENRMRYWRQCGPCGVVEWIVSLFYRESRRGLHNPTHWYLTCVLDLYQPQNLRVSSSQSQSQSRPRL